MTQSRRPGRPRSEEADTAVLQSTLELLAEHGVHGFGMETVAQKAGVAKTTVYRRWPNKNELILDALVHLKGAPEPPATGSVRGDLLQIVTRMRDQPRADTGARIIRHIMAEQECCPELVVQFRDRIVRPRRELCHNVLRRGIAEGVIHADVDVELVTDLLCSSLLVCHMSRARAYSDTELAFFVDTVLAGIAPTPPATN